MDLAEGVKDVNGQEKWVYTINGKTSPDIPPIKVEKGDKVKIRFKNKGKKFIQCICMDTHSGYF